MARNSNQINYMLFAAGFAILNVIMYLLIRKFWIGGSSFLPLIGISGPNDKFLIAGTVNIGVIIGAFIGAISSGDFIFRLPKKTNLINAIVGGFLIGIGVTLAPGTCTTEFVTGMPMLSVSSFLSAAGTFIGGFFIYTIMVSRIQRK